MLGNMHGIGKFVAASPKNKSKGQVFFLRTDYNAWHWRVMSDVSMRGDASSLMTSLPSLSQGNTWLTSLHMQIHLGLLSKFWETSEAEAARVGAAMVG